MIIETRLLWIAPNETVFLAVIAVMTVSLFYYDISMGVIVVALYFCVHGLVGNWFYESVVNTVPFTVYTMVGCALLASFCMATMDIDKH